MLGLYCNSAVAGVFIVGTGAAEGTVTDSTTNLMWQQCSAGLSGTSCTTGSAALYIWDNAISYCEGLSLGGFTDWRLPNVKELESIADKTAFNPAINATYFPNTVPEHYWSSTTNSFNTRNASYVSFYFGNAGRSITKAYSYYVRCVRGQ